MPVTKHIVLLGDSIFDNQPYVGLDGKPVTAYLKNMLQLGSEATLLAVDGDRIENVFAQMKNIPEDTTHLL